MFFRFSPGDPIRIELLYCYTDMMSAESLFQKLYDNTSFKCGGCERFFISVYRLHDHLRDHVEGGSYKYNHKTKIAFPVLTSREASTQTCLSDIMETKAIKIEHLDLLDDKMVKGIQHKSNEIVEGTESLDVNNSEAYDEMTDVESNNDYEEEGYSKPDVTSDHSSEAYGEMTDVESNNDYEEEGYSKPDVTSDHSKGADEIRSDLTSRSDEEMDAVSTDMVNNSERTDSQTNGNASTETKENNLLECKKKIWHERWDNRRGQTRKRTEVVKDAIKNKLSKCREIRVTLTKLDDSLKPKKLMETKSKMLIQAETQSSILGTEDTENVKMENDIPFDATMTKDNNEPNSHKITSVNQENLKENSSKTTCEICNKQFRLYSYLRRHRVKKHKLPPMKAGRPTTIHVENIEKSGKTQTSGDTENSKKGSSNIQCEICNQQFRLYSYLRKHLISKHKLPPQKPGRPKKYDDPNGIYRCDKCDKIILLRKRSEHERYHRHGQRQSDKNSVVCDVCGQLFSKTGIVSHARVHSAEHLKCQRCDLDFNSIEELNIHRNQMHYKIPVQCKVCGTVLASNKSLTQHVRSLHMKEKRSKCDICGMDFYIAARMRKHRVIHFEAKFQCSFCERKFKDVHSKKRHEKTHTRDEKYICHICNHGFIQSTPYWVHMERKHSLSKEEAMSIRQELNSATMKLK